VSSKSYMASLGQRVERAVDASSAPVNRVGAAIPGFVGYDYTRGWELRRDA
jgi:hypothetical protein